MPENAMMWDTELPEECSRDRLVVHRTDHQTLMSILSVDAQGYTWHCFGSSVGPPPSVHRLLEASRILSWTNAFVNLSASRQHVSNVVTIRHSLFKIAPWFSGLSRLANDPGRTLHANYSWP